jgi:hypothetical protein
MGIRIAGAALAVFWTVAPAEAAPRTEETHRRTFYGVMQVGQTDSSVGEAIFITRSPVGTRIFQGCQMGDFCRLEADVTKRDLVRRAISVSKVPAFDTPDALMRYIYLTKPMIGSGEVADDDLEQIFTPRLSNIIRQARDRIKAGEVKDAFDTPWFSAQEGKPVDIKINTVRSTVSDIYANSYVTYRNNADDQNRILKYHFMLNNTSNGWRIDEVRLPFSSATANDSYSEILVNPNGTQ